MLCQSAYHTSRFRRRQLRHAEAVILWRRDFCSWHISDKPLDMPNLWIRGRSSGGGECLWDLTRAASFGLVLQVTNDEIDVRVA